MFADICVKAIEEYKCSTDRALDLMSSVGRLAFQLSNTFEKVISDFIIWLTY